MAFLAALPEIAGAAGGAAEAGGAAGGAAEAGEAGSSGGLFKSTPKPGQGEQNKQQNSGASRNFNFQDAFNSIRSAIRPGGGVD
jgi:hypothetical protein